MERKQGQSNLERMCQEIEEEKRIQEQRRELKRQKKKRKKALAKSERENQAQLSQQESGHCEVSTLFCVVVMLCGLWHFRVLSWMHSSLVS